MQPPESRSTRDIDHVISALLLQKLRGLHTPMSTLTDEQYLAVFRDLLHTLR